MNALRTILLSLMLLALPVAAQAYSLTWDNYTAPGVTFTPSGGSFATSSQGGVGSLGVSGGVNGEISIGQSILISFDTPQFVNTLELSLLYTSGNYGDVGDEIASMTAFGSGGGTPIASATLTATTPVLGTLTGPGTVLNLDPAVENSGALWQISNPFGNTAVSSILLTALDNGVFGSTGSTNSDYGFHALTTTATPIPGAVWLLGAGLAGLGTYRRLRSRAD